MKIIKYYLPLLFLTAFALLTLFMSGSVIFDLFGIRAKEGNYVLFIVWTNFICGIIYLIAAYNWLKLKNFTYKILSSATVLLIISYTSLFIHINNGGLYEEKTVRAMLFRIVITLIFALISYFTLPRSRKKIF